MTYICTYAIYVSRAKTIGRNKYEGKKSKRDMCTYTIYVQRTYTIYV